jgi:hypothetical protein
VDWHRRQDGDRQTALVELLGRVERELGGPLTGTRFVYDARDMLTATREIEAAVRGSGTVLFVGFQRAEKADGEAGVYRDLVEGGVRVVGFGTGEPRGVPGIRWVALPEDPAALQNNWFLATEEPEPIAFVGFETSPPELFGRVGVTDPNRTWAGFVSDDRRLVHALTSHLATLSGEARR